MIEITGYPKAVFIRCPNCETVQAAEIHFYIEDPFPSYVHECSCGYFILESEWEEIEIDSSSEAKYEPA